MGKKLYTKQDISKTKTEWLGIPELAVIADGSDDTCLEVIHRRYFKDEKLPCPACHSLRTRCSKIVDRKLKDLLWLDDEHQEFKIVNLLYHQRYLRCDDCGQSVFPETTEFGEKGCRFTKTCLLTIWSSCLNCFGRGNNEAKNTISRVPVTSGQNTAHTLSC